MRRRNIIFYCGLLLPFFSAQAATLEKEATGFSAKPFVQALKLAGIVPKKTAHGYDYVADSLYCHTSQAFDDGLMEYDCKINTKIIITAAPAKVLYDAMVDLKMNVDAGMSQTRITAKQVRCRIDTSTSVIFHCQWQEPQ